MNHQGIKMENGGKKDIRNVRGANFKREVLMGR